MLTYLRKKQRAILKWTLFLVIPSFIAFYGWSEITGADPTMEDPNTWWIRVKGPQGGWTEISQWEFRQAKDSLVNRYGSMMQNQMGPQASQYARQIESLLGNDRIAMEAIDNAILRQYAEERGLTVSESEVRQMIQQQFRGATKEQAQQYLQQIGMSEQQFAAELQYSMLLEKARREVTSPAFVSAFEVWQEYSVGKQQVKVAALEFNQSEFVDQVAVDEQALGEYYKENIEKYRVPEKRAYEYVKIDKLKIAQELEVDDAALKAYYEANAADFAIEQGVKVRQILRSVPPDADADSVEAVRVEIEKLAERAQAGEDFAALANEHSQDPGNTKFVDMDSTATMQLGGLMENWITKKDSTAQMGQEFVDAALALKQGEVSSPIRTFRGWVILKAEEVREASQPSYEDVTREEVESKYREAKSMEIYAERRGKLAEAISDLTDLQEIADATGLTIAKTEPQNATSFMFPGVGNLTPYELYFSDLQKGDLVAGLMEIPNANAPTAAVFMRLDDIALTYLPELSEVRQRVEGDWKRTQALDMAKAKADEAASKVTSVEDLEKMAAEAGKTLKQTTDLVLLEEINSAGLPRIENFSADLVRTPVGKARVSTIQSFFGASTGGYAVWIITEKVDADRAAFREELNQLQTELLNLKRQTLLNEFLASRRDALRVEYNKMVLGDLAAN